MRTSRGMGTGLERCQWGEGKTSPNPPGEMAPVQSSSYELRQPNLHSSKSPCLPGLPRLPHLPSQWSPEPAARY